MNQECGSFPGAEKCYRTFPRSEQPGNEPSLFLLSGIKDHPWVYVSGELKSSDAGTPPTGTSSELPFQTVSARMSWPILWELLGSSEGIS